MPTRLSGTLRLIMGLMVIASMIVAGFLSRSAWIVLIATPPFTALYAAGKFPAWRGLWQTRGAGAVFLVILTTLPIQAVLAGVFYLIGLGLSMVSARNEPLAPLSLGDWLAAGVLFAVVLAVACVINVLESGVAIAAPTEPAVVVTAGDEDLYASEDLELDMDPRPLTPESFYLSPGYWKMDVLQKAIEERGATIVRPPVEATQDMIAAAEQRLQVRLPEGLRRLYRIMDGGYLGDLYVPLKPQPGPSYDDWRGAFSIDYSSLASVGELRTVYDHYQDFTHEPEDLPKHARDLVVLQARYGDMTLLDYSKGPDARVVIVDFERRPDNPVDIAFDDFGSFFAALRRPKPEKLTSGDRLLGWRTPPFSERSPATRNIAFWTPGDAVHRVTNIAKSRKDGSEPAAKADDALIAATEARLGVRLPPDLMAMWREKNGGQVAYGYLRSSAEGEAYAEEDLPEALLPLEYMTTIRELSDRILMPEGKASLADGFPDAEKIVILEASERRALLLDYRDGPEPAVVLAGNIEKDGLSGSISCRDVTEFLARLRALKPRN